MACNDELSNICMDPIKSTCVDHEGPLGTNTKITDSCVTQFDVNGDLYAILDEQIANSNLDDLGSDCLSYDLTDGVVLLKSVLKKYEETICEQQQKIADLEALDYSQLDVTGWGLTIPACIADPCDSPPTTLGPLLQAIMDNRNCT